MNRELKIRIIEKGYKVQADFAQAIAMNEDRLSRIIHQRVVPTRGEMTKIAEMLDCEVGDLF